MWEAIDSTEKAVTNLTITLSYDPFIRQVICPAPTPSGERGFFIGSVREFN